MLMLRFKVMLQFPVVTCNLYIINYKFCFFVIVSGSTLPSTTDESLHEYVEDEYTHSSIRDPCEILWCISLGPHHDRLATYHLSCREMAARDTHVSCARRRDDGHVTGCCYHPWPPYRQPSSHWDTCVQCGGVVRGAARCHPTR